MSRRTRMLVLKLGQIIDIIVNNDIKIASGLMGCDLVLGECFRHDDND